MSILPYRYSCFDWNPDPDVRSSVSVSSCPFSRILPRPSPQVMSNSSLKFPAAAIAADQTTTATITTPQTAMNFAISLSSLTELINGELEADQWRELGASCLSGRIRAWAGVYIGVWSTGRWMVPRSE
uniref:Uncharacterized protein n=1 Tax=Oryza brachyantha TaxID=4533 RepID=J3MH69_ORYBR